MAEENFHAEIEWPRKRQRTKGPSDTSNVSRSMNDPIKRATRACDQCRTQKKRCDSGRPCYTCTKASLDCHYGKQAKKRGFPTGYVRIIEALWAVVFRAVPSSQETALDLLRHASLGYDDEGKATLVNFHFDTVDSSRKAWLSSSIRHEIERLASEPEDGERSGWALERGTSRSKPAAGPSLSSASNFPTWTMPEDILCEDSSRKQSDSPAIPEDSGTESYNGAEILYDYQIGLQVPLPVDPWKLAEIYFKLNHCWLPITPKHTIVRTLTELQDGVKCSSSELSLLWAIFAIASTQQLCVSGEQSSISDKYYHEAMKNIPSDFKALKPGHIEALVHLTMLNMARGYWETASLVLRRSIFAILQLRRLYQYQQNSAATSPILYRIILAAFAMDTLLAARSGTIPQLCSRDVCWATQYDENEADEWEQWSMDTVIQSGGNEHAISRRPLRSLSIFKQYVQLLSILNDSLRDLCLIEDYEVKLNDCRSKLGSWKAELPKHCQYPVTGAEENELGVVPSLANLHFTAETVSRFLLVKRNMSIDLTTQPLTSNESFPTISVYKTAYENALGAAAWRGILDFHEYVNHAERRGIQTQVIVPDRNSRHDMYHLPVSGAVNHSVTNHNLHSQPDLSVLTSEPALEASTTRFTRPCDSFSQLRESEGPFANSTNKIMTEEVPYTSLLEQNRFQVMKNLSRANITFVSPDLNRRTTSVAHRPSDAYDDLGNEDTIETLLEELSAQQNVNWDEMEAQCMYNLGFLRDDHVRH